MLLVRAPIQVVFVGLCACLAGATAMEGARLEGFGLGREWFQAGSARERV